MWAWFKLHMTPKGESYSCNPSSRPKVISPEIISPETNLMWPEIVIKSVCNIYLVF